MKLPDTKVQFEFDKFAHPALWFKWGSFNLPEAGHVYLIDQLRFRVLSHAKPDDDGVLHFKCEIVAD